MDLKEIDILNIEIQNENILKSVNILMNKAEKLFKTGSDKRNYVINSIESFIVAIYGIEAYKSKYEHIINETIEFIISLSRGVVKVDINKIKRFCC